MLGRARLKIDFRKKTGFLILTLLIGQVSWAQEIISDLPEPGGLDSTLQAPATPAPQTSNLPGNGLVEIIYPVEILVPYKERRPDHQFVFHFQFERFKPEAARFSNQGAYANVFDGPAPMFSLNLGYKFNVPLVGLELSALIGSGGLSGGVNETSYSVQKKGLRIAAVFDDFMDEPYVAPYVGLQFIKWDFNEVSAVGKSSVSPDTVMGTQAGLLLQLNWLEPKASLLALKEEGLNNSYLDLFFQQYPSTSGVDLATSFNWGAGFRLEY